ncbi:MAG: kynureninase [Actinomycetota bacterium]|nr:kynureninase [Actinomycetota bacterium]
MIERGDAERLDAADPLASFRGRFVIDDPDTLYLDGNSLGRLPLASRQALHERIDQWGADLVTGWDEWIDLPQQAGDLLAAGVLGALPGEVIVTDSTTVNLFKLASAVLAQRKGAIVTDSGNFPTDRYVLDGLARRHGRELISFDADPIAGPQAAGVARACGGNEIALVCLSHVAYRSGALADVELITREAPAPLIWDLSHSAGAVPIELNDWGVELAVGCTYKYLNGGPGAPAYLYIAESCQQDLRTPIQGWFGQRDQFEMERPYDPKPGIRGWLAGTPSILATTAVEQGARLIAEAGTKAIGAKAEALTSFLVELHDEWLASMDFELGTPRDPSARGAHVSLRHEQAPALTSALIEQAKVIPDFRGPNSIRLGLSPLYTSFADVHEAMRRLRELAAPRSSLSSS